MPWIPDVTLPPCPNCGAPNEDQALTPAGGQRMVWRCLVCEHHVDPPPGWTYELREVTDEQLRVINARLRERGRKRRGQ